MGSLGRFCCSLWAGFQFCSGQFSNGYTGLHRRSCFHSKTWPFGGQGSAREEKSVALLVSFEQLCVALTSSIPMIAFGSDVAFVREVFDCLVDWFDGGSSHPADCSAGAALQLVGSAVCFGQGARRGLLCPGCGPSALTPAGTML